MLMYEEDISGTQSGGRPDNTSSTVSHRSGPGQSDSQIATGQSASTFGQQYTSSYGTRAGNLNPGSGDIRTTTLTLNFPDIGNPGRRIVQNRLYYIPPTLYEIDIRIGARARWFTMWTPNIPVGELLDDFIPLAPGTPSSRKVLRMVRIQGNDQESEIHDLNTLIGQLEHEEAWEGRHVLRLGFRDS